MSLFMDTFDNLDKWIELVPGYRIVDGQLIGNWANGKMIMSVIGDAWTNYSFQYDHIYTQAYGQTLLLLRMQDAQNYYALVIWAGQFESAIREFQLWKVVNGNPVLLNSVSFFASPPPLPATVKISVVDEGTAARFNVYLNTTLVMEAIDDPKTFSSGRIGITANSYETRGDNVLVDAIPPPSQGGLLIDTTPVKGEVFLNEISQGIAPVNLVLNAGLYPVHFGPVSGYTSPPDIDLEIVAGETRTYTATYTPIAPPPPTLGTLDIHIFHDATEVSATFIIRETGEQYNSPVTVQLPPGNYTLYVPFYDLTSPGHVVVAGQTTLATIRYTPVPRYILQVNSSPTDIPFTITIGGITTSYTTPFSGSFEPDVYKINMPPQIIVGTVPHDFTRWADGDPSPQKTLTLAADTALFATYTAAAPPPPPTPKTLLVKALTPLIAGGIGIIFYRSKGRNK